MLAADQWARAQPAIDADRIIPVRPLAGRQRRSDAGGRAARAGPHPRVDVHQRAGLRATGGRARIPGARPARHARRRAHGSRGRCWCCTATTMRSCPPITAARWLRPRRERRCDCSRAATTTARARGPTSGPSSRRRACFLRSRAEDARQQPMSPAASLALADALVVVHLAFVLFVVLGGLLVMRWPRMAWAHVPAAVWGALVEFAGAHLPADAARELAASQGRRQRLRVGLRRALLRAAALPRVALTRRAVAARRHRDRREPRRLRRGRAAPVRPVAARCDDPRDDARVQPVTFTIELEHEDDGRWLAEVPGLAGVMCYGQNRDDAVARVQALALRVLAERLEHGEGPPELFDEEIGPRMLARVARVTGLSPDDL